MTQKKTTMTWDMAVNLRYNTTGRCQCKINKGFGISRSKKESCVCAQVRTAAWKHTLHRERSVLKNEYLLQCYILFTSCKSSKD